MFYRIKFQLMMMTMTIYDNFDDENDQEPDKYFDLLVKVYYFYALLPGKKGHWPFKNCFLWTPSLFSQLKRQSNFSLLYPLNPYMSHISLYNPSRLVRSLMSSPLPGRSLTLCNHP